jgi:uncharacterized LabA/DUF88 family protein
MTSQDPKSPHTGDGPEAAPERAPAKKKPAARATRSRKPAATTATATAPAKQAAKPRSRGGKGRRPKAELVRDEPANETQQLSEMGSDQTPTEAAVADLLSSYTPAHAGPFEDLFSVAPTPVDEPSAEPAPAPVRRYRFDRRNPAVSEQPQAEQPQGIESAPVEHPEQAAEVVKTPLSETASPSVMNGTHAETPAEEAAPETSPQAEASETGTAEAVDATADGAGPTRRRRRRRRPAGHAGAEDAEALTAEPEAPEVVALPPEPEPFPPSAPYKPGGRGRRAPARKEPEAPAALAPAEPQPDWGQSDVRPWTPEGGPSPYDSPEPSMARGFGPQPRAVAQAAREPQPRGARTTLDVPPISSNTLASTITSSIQTMTDRLLVEMRRQPPTPQMTVMMSNSTERVGVFVDVANVVYSARALRNQVDFGHLLTFLRGNRRLIRAHAYAPTEPDPRGEQMFLSVVKGHGYRITTKNYKTFASGAKKADLDLDLCMDIVRLVDSGAIDTLVLVSGDSDFLPLLEYCSDKGVRVEVAAFDDAAAAILRQSCDLFINLSRVPDILA